MAEAWSCAPCAELDIDRVIASADAVVVGSAIVDAVRTSLDDQEQATDKTVDAVLDLVRDISAGVRG